MMVNVIPEYTQNLPQAVQKNYVIEKIFRMHKLLQVVRNIHYHKNCLRELHCYLRNNYMVRYNKQLQILNLRDKD